MQTYAWNIEFISEYTDVPQINSTDIIQISPKVFFVLWEADVTDRESLLVFLETHIGPIESYDISLESEDNMQIFANDYIDGVYESVSFEWPVVSFADIVERFADTESVVVVREAEESELYGNRIIKVDFMY